MRDIIIMVIVVATNTDVLEAAEVLVVKR